MAMLVLIAEDEIAIADVLLAVVEEAGYTAVVARNGRDALALAHVHRPDLLITDLMMPEMDGPALIAALRAEYRPDLSVILVTAAALNRTIAAGASAVLRKPFDIEALEALLGTFLPSTP